MENKTFQDDKIIRLLKTDDLIPIDQQHKENLKEILTAYIPVSEPSTKVVIQHVFKQAMLDVWYQKKIGLLVLLLGLLAVTYFLNSFVDTTLLFFISSPAPIVIIGWHLLSEHNTSMVELEITYKYTFRQVVCAKVVAVSFISIVFYTVLFILLIVGVGAGTVAFTEVLHMLLIGLMPILVWSYLLLTFYSKYRNHSIWTIFAISWMFFAILILTTSIGESILAASLVMYILINLGSIIIFFRKLHQIWRMERIEFV